MFDARALDDRTSVIALHGHADLALSRDLQLAVLDGARSGRTRVVLDMSDVARVEPGVLGALLRLRRLLLAMGGGLAVVSLQPAADLFNVAMSDQLLGRAVSLEQALGLFG
ncbi:MAG TPA: STAS domain-containing protein [Solirubrobacteraceae bacterium]|jgi:anti-anti-sigma regulatory factor